jgi:HSP20 family protein
MVVERYDPFHNALTLRSMIDRLFDESFLRPFGAFAPEGTLALDITESDDAYTVKASLPGVKPRRFRSPRRATPSRSGER